MFRQALKRLEKPDIELRVQFVEMKSLRRFKATGAEYFITTVTFNREPLLHHSLEMFWQSWGEVQLTAWVVLPEHFHALLSPGNESISEVIHRFKITYSRRFRDAFRSGQVWQNRFWDHVIRDQDDLNRHIDYIHYNPVHHGLALDPFMWSTRQLIHGCRKDSIAETGEWKKNQNLMESMVNKTCPNRVGFLRPSTLRQAQGDFGRRNADLQDSRLYRK